jgi:hypothetical protein
MLCPSQDRNREIAPPVFLERRFFRTLRGFSSLEE